MERDLKIDAEAFYVFLIIATVGNYKMLPLPQNVRHNVFDYLFNIPVLKVERANQPQSNDQKIYEVKERLSNLKAKKLPKFIFKKLI